MRRAGVLALSMLVARELGMHWRRGPVQLAWQCVAPGSGVIDSSVLARARFGVAIGGARIECSHRRVGFFVIF